MNNNAIYNIRASDLDALIAYQLFNSIKLHFSNKSYDYGKYGINKRAFNEKSLAKRPDIRYYTRFAEKILYQDRFIPLLVATLYNNPKCWVGELVSPDNVSRAVLYRKYINTFGISFTDDIRNLLFKGNILSVKELYSQNSKSNYFGLLSKGLIHPITAAILNELYYTKYMANTPMAFVYADKAFYLNRYYIFIPKELRESVTEEIVNNIQKDI